MHAIARAARRLALVGAVIALIGVLGASAVTPAAGAEYAVRLEAGPQQGVAFDGDWHITGTKLVTLTSPATVSASWRHWVSGTSVYLRITGGSLAGWWVRESRVAYIPGFAGTTTYSPPRAGTLAAGKYEVYHFDATGLMTAAKRRSVTATTTFRADRRAFINGRSHVRIADGSWAGWWIPGSTTSPSAIRCTAGSPPSSTTARTVSSVASATGEIALTFDMGGRLTDALSIIRFLELERVCATIFPTGAAAQTTIGRQVMAEIRAHAELFEMGNHTVHHCNLRDGGGGAACPPEGTRPTVDFVTAELQDANAILVSLAGRGSTPYWRPPYGAVDTTLRDVAESAGYPFTIMWSTDTIDWRPVADGGPTASQIAAKVIAGRKAGAIVLMHLGGYNTRNALPAMLQGLGTAAYTPTTLSALYRSGH
jgi:peptidoglycan/xylan/chitin deacetylase (PgdA/CDA1 family)